MSASSKYKKVYATWFHIHDIQNRKHSSIVTEIRTIIASGGEELMGERHEETF